MKKTVLFLFSGAVTALMFTACGGNEEKPAPTTEVPTEVKTETPDKPVAADGETVFKNNCLACHQANGEGIAATFPPLAKSDFLVNREGVIEQVIKGKTGEMTVNGVKYNNTMPPQPISDEEIAAVLTYVYSSWGNSGNAFTVDEVKAVRAKLK